MSEVQITPSDLVEASRVHFRTSRGLLLVLAAMVVTVVALNVTQEHTSVSYRAKLALVCVVLFGLWFALAYFVIIPVRARLTFQRQKSLQRPYDLTWNEEGVLTRNVNVNALTPWADYRKWQESRNLFVIYLSDRLFHIAPKRAFNSTEAIASFRMLLQGKIAPIRGRVRK